MKDMKNSKLSTTIIAILIIAMLFATILLQNSMNDVNASLLTATATPIDLTKTGWDSEAGNYSKTRYCAGGGPDAADKLWTRTIPGVSGQVPVAFNGLVFVKNSTTLFALKYDTGETVWAARVPGVPSIQGTAIGSPWKINEEYMVSGQTLLRISDGSVVWEANTTAPVPTDTGSQGFWACNSYIPELKLAYGAGQVWNMSDLSKPPKLVWQMIGLYNDGMGSGACYGNGKLFLGSEDGYQGAYDIQTGKRLWLTFTKGEMGYDSLYYQGMLIRGGTVDNIMYAFDESTGELKWTFDTHDWYAFWDHVSAAYGMIYAINQDRSTYALNATTGKVVWKYDDAGIYYQGSILIGGGKVYGQTAQSQGMDRMTGIPTGIGHYTCLDAYTGQPIWQIDRDITTSGAGNDPISLAYGNMYIFAGSQLWCLGPSKDWGMFRHDAAHTAEGQSGPQRFNVQWTFDTKAPLMGSPVISDGKLYEGSEDGTLYCLDAKTGAYIWKYTINDMLRSTPAAVNGKVYIGPDDGYVYCLDGNNGSLLWKYNAGYQFIYSRSKPPLRSSPMVLNNRLYVGTLGNETICLDANTGTLIWKYSMPGYVTASPCVTNNAVYTICYYMAPGVLSTPRNDTGSATLYKLSATDGTLLKTYAIPLGIGTAGSAVIGRGEIWASPTVADGMIFQPAQAWKIYGINETTGNIQWTFTVPDSVFTTASMTYVNATGRVYFSSRFNMVCANAFNGTVYWQTYSGREIFSSSAYADGKIYYQTDSRLAYCLDATTGAKLGWYELDSEAWASPTVWNGKLYVGCQDNLIYCFGDFPLPAPVVKPTPSPTPKPTAVPTAQPTAVPTAQPTAIPTESPTSTPAVTASPAPSVTEQPISSSLPMEVVYAVVAVIVIVIIAAAAFMLRKRSK
jgi:outer membrane protein assembly factor BamB